MYDYSYMFKRLSGKYKNNKVIKNIKKLNLKKFFIFMREQNY